MLNNIANFLNRKEILYKRVKFPYYSSLRDSKQVCYISKFVTSEFVIVVTFCKGLLKILPGTQSLRYFKDFATSMISQNEFYCYRIEKNKNIMYIFHICLDWVDGRRSVTV